MDTTTTHPTALYDMTADGAYIGVTEAGELVCQAGDTWMALPVTVREMGRLARELTEMVGVGGDYEPESLTTAAGDELAVHLRQLELVSQEADGSISGDVVLELGIGDALGLAVMLLDAADHLDG